MTLPPAIVAMRPAAFSMSDAERRRSRRAERDRVASGASSDPPGSHRTWYSMIVEAVHGSQRRTRGGEGTACTSIITSERPPMGPTSA